MAGESRIVPLPELAESDPRKRLGEFYAKLGSRPPERVNPSRVVMNPEDLARMISDSIPCAESASPYRAPRLRLFVSLIYLKKGPSGDDEVPAGMVLLKDGWTKMPGTQNGLTT